MGEEKLENAKFIYVGERAFWKYKSTWGLTIPSVDSQRLQVGKNSVARLYVDYANRVILIKVVDVRLRGDGVEEEVINLLHGASKKDVERLIDKLQKMVEEEKDVEVEEKKKTIKKKSAPQIEMSV